MEFIKQEFPKFFSPAPADLIWLMAINWFTIEGENKCTFCGFSGFGEIGTIALPLECLPATGTFGTGTGFDGRLDGGPLGWTGGTGFDGGPLGKADWGAR